MALWSTPAKALRRSSTSSRRSGVTRCSSRSTRFASASALLGHYVPSVFRGLFPAIVPMQLRNYGDVGEYLDIVYAHPEYVETLDTSTPIADHVAVDFELRGCPISKHQLLEVISAFLHDRRPAIASHSVCVECKLRLNVCVMVAPASASRTAQVAGSSPS